NCAAEELCCCALMAHPGSGVPRFDQPTSGNSSHARTAFETQDRVMTSVDVVIPAYNYGHYLPACVRSVTSQRGVDVRVLIIDDASTDDTFAVAQRLAADDRRVEARRHVQNQGHIATYNEGLLAWACAD